MSRNGSGIYQLPAGQPVVTGTIISSTTFNTLTTDLANALTTSLATDGQTAMSANLPMGGNKAINQSAATTAGDSVRYEQVGALAIAQGAVAVGANIQLGSSATDTQNFLLKTNIDGTGKLARGAAGSLGDIVSWNASGQVLFPNSVISGNGPAFSAWQSTAQTIPSAITTKLQFQSEEFDTGNCFDSTANSRFQPTVAGYFTVTAGMGVPSAARSGEVQILLFKNGSSYKSGPDSSGGNVIITSMTALVFLNGTTDYLESYIYLQTGGTTVPVQSQTYFQASMTRGA